MAEKRLIDANAIPKLFEKKYEETEQRILDGEIYLDTLAEGSFPLQGSRTARRAPEDPHR